MVKKLFKHELLAYMRILLPVWGILLGVAALGRMVQLFEQDSVAYRIISGSSVTFYVIGIVACLVFPIVFGVQRFYKNLFTGEGYLSFTLPVTPFQHIWVKVSAAVLLTVATLLVAFVSLAVMTAGEVFAEIMKAAGYLLKQLFQLQEYAVHIVFYVIEFIISLVLALFTEFLLFYTCIAIGQTFKKNRVLGAVGIYFLYYFLCQILGTVIIVFLSGVPETWYEALMQFIDREPLLFMHLLLCGGALVTAVIGAVYFLVTHTIIRKKLNLE